MNTLTKSASISFDATALVDWASEFYALDRLTAGLDAHMPGSFGHSRRVARLAASTAKQLGLPGEGVTRVRRAGSLHDVGKVEVPVEIISKPGPLSEDEFEVVRKHAAIGARMVARATGDEELAEMVRHHHERYDGDGYPDGLSGDEIPVGARIIAVADTFDAVTSPRPYRPALDLREALTLLEHEAGSQFDPKVIGAFRGRYSGIRGHLGLRRVAFRG
jgi:putative nucleotidyltransferase with HDIG domain